MLILTEEPTIKSFIYIDDRSIPRWCELTNQQEYGLSGDQASMATDILLGITTGQNKDLVTEYQNLSYFSLYTLGYIDILGISIRCNDDYCALSTHGKELIWLGQWSSWILSLLKMINYCTGLVSNSVGFKRIRASDFLKILMKRNEDGQRRLQKRKFELRSMPKLVTTIPRSTMCAWLLRTRFLSNSTFAWLMIFLTFFLFELC